MTDLEKILIGAVVALAGALVLAIVKWSAARVAKRVEDQPRVDAKLSLTTHLEVLQQFGSPCMIVRIIGVSDRPTRIAGVEASLVVDQAFVDAFEKGFGFSFSQGTPSNLPPPRFDIELFPVGDVEKDIIKLERDDVAEFLLPVPFTPYEHFLRAPSQNVEIAMRTADGDRKVLVRGLEIQEMLLSIIQLQGDRLRNPKVEMKMRITVSSKEIPPVGHGVGKVNRGAVDLPPPGP